MLYLCSSDIESGKYMNKEQIINEAVTKAYNNLVAITEVKATFTSTYIETIASFLPKESYEYLDEIIDKLFWKFCKDKKNFKNEPYIYNYRTFCLNEPNEEVLIECLALVRDCIQNKNNEKTLFSLLKPLREKYPSSMNTNVVDTIFDILLNYYLDD